MSIRPSALTHLMVGFRMEWSRVRQSPTIWLLAALLAGLGVALGIHEGFSDPFTPLRVAMFLSLPTALWGWQAATSGAGDDVRELLLARNADEWLLHLSRVLVNGSVGGTLTLLFPLASLVPGGLLITWPSRFLWVVVVFVAHLSSAAIGAAAGLVFHRFPMLGMLASGGIWWLVVDLAVRLGPTSPDPLLRVLQWNQILQDGAVESLYTPLVLSHAALALGAILVGMMGFALSQRMGLRVSRAAVTRQVVWAGSFAFLLLSALVLSMYRTASEEALSAGGDASGPVRLVWNPAAMTITIQQPSGERVIQGPIRPSVVALSEQRFEPYVGRQGVVVPLSSIFGQGKYALSLEIPDGWSAFGCADLHATEGDLFCLGERAQDDWLIVLRDQALEVAEAALEARNPAQAEAQQLFSRLISAGFAQLGLNPPDIFFLGTDRPWYLSPRALVGPRLQAREPAVTQRQAVHHAASAIMLYLSDQRSNQPDEDLLPLLATLDRLLFELNVVDIDPMEVVRRTGKTVDPANLVYLPLPLAEEEVFNRWWVAVDGVLAAGRATPSSLWDALSQIEDTERAKAWPTTFGRLMGSETEVE